MKLPTREQVRSLIEFVLDLLRLARDSLLLIVGLVGVLHEAFAADVPNRDLLLLFGAMMGLPWFLRADERRNDKPKKGD